MCVTGRVCVCVCYRRCVCVCYRRSVAVCVTVGVCVSVLQEMCRGVHHNIETIDEERYDLEMKVNKCNKEVKSSPSPLSPRLLISSMLA